MIPLDIERRFISLINSDRNYQEAKKLVEVASSGRVWLIGGYLFRNLVNLIDGNDMLIDFSDIDFLAESLKDYFDVPSKWKVEKNSWGNLRFTTGGRQVDLVAMKNLHPFQDRPDMPKIEEFLGQTPFTVQSIALDIPNNRFIVGAAFKAIEERVVEVNNPREAEVLARYSRLSVACLLREKAISLGFNVGSKVAVLG